MSNRHSGSNAPGQNGRERNLTGLREHLLEAFRQKSDDVGAICSGCGSVRRAYEIVAIGEEMVCVGCAPEPPRSRK